MCAISVGVMFADHRQDFLDTIRQTLSLIVYPIQYVVSLPASFSGWASENLDSRESLLEENKQLKQDHIKFRAQLQKLAALKAENHRLRELLQSSRKVGEHVLIGELLAVDLDPFSRQIVINKGSRDNIYMRQPVLDAHGIMGQIVYVSPFSSTAMLITDANHAIPVQVNRNNLRAIVEGNGSTDTMDINFLPNSADIKEGDLLTSSGLGGVYPPDYPVARVKSVVKNPAKPYAKIVVEPVALLEKSRQVLMVWHSERGQEQESTPYVDQSLPFENNNSAQGPATATTKRQQSQNQEKPATAATNNKPKPKPQPVKPATTSATNDKPKPKPQPVKPATTPATNDKPKPKPQPVKPKPASAESAQARDSAKPSATPTPPVDTESQPEAPVDEAGPNDQGNNDNDAQ